MSWSRRPPAHSGVGGVFLVASLDAACKVRIVEAGGVIARGAISSAENRVQSSWVSPHRVAMGQVTPRQENPRYEGGRCSTFSRLAKSRKSGHRARNAARSRFE